MSALPRIHRDQPALGTATVEPEQDYYAIPAISASGINRFLNDSRLHYWMESPFNPDREPCSETPALVFGRLAHCMALNPTQADQDFVVAPEIIRRTNDGKAEYAAFLDSANGKTVVTAEQWKQAVALRDAMNRNAAVRQLLGQGVAEEPTTWQRHDTPLTCKAKFDYLRQGLVIDYKTTLCTRTDEFRRTIAKFGYHRQMPWYMEAAQHQHGERPRGAVIIAQNKDLPDDIGIFALDSDALSTGELECCYAVRQITERMESGDWRSHPAEIQPIGLPGWYLKSQL